MKLVEQMKLFQLFRKTTINEFGRLMSLDVGEKSVGVAITDSNLNLDSERSCVFFRKDQAGEDKPADIVARELSDMINTHSVKGVIIGVPIGSAATSNSAKIKTECLMLSPSSSRFKVKPIAAELLLQRYVDHVQREV